MLKKILLLDKPSEFIREYKNSIFELVPELKICDGFDQHNDYHIYDVFEHILHVLDGVENNYLLRIAALFHDIGKPCCFVVDDNKVGHFYGHWNESNRIFNKYIEIFGLNEEEVTLIHDLIFYHDLEFKDDNLEMFNSVFGDNLSLLISLKRADVLAQNPKYEDRLVHLEKNAQLIRAKK